MSPAGFMYETTVSGCSISDFHVLGWSSMCHNVEYHVFNIFSMGISHLLVHVLICDFSDDKRCALTGGISSLDYWMEGNIGIIPLCGFRWKQNVVMPFSELLPYLHFLAKCTCYKCITCRHKMRKHEDRRT